MIYPSNYEHKIGFDEIRALLKEHCLSPLGCGLVDRLCFTSSSEAVNEQLAQIREFRQLMETATDFPLQNFIDVREAVSRIRMAGTHFEEQEVWDLRRTLETIGRIVTFLAPDSDDEPRYPNLTRLTKDVPVFPAMIRRIDSILDKFGRIKDGASMTLAGLRHELKNTEGSISRTLYSILHSAQRDGLVDKDAAPTMRDGRLMIPVSPSVKRRINGIVHDESATGKTVFIEPAEVVEANNRIRELEAEERREITRILTVFSDEVRPQVGALLTALQFLALVDLIHAKACLARRLKCTEPEVADTPMIDWIQAVHPLLAISLQKQEKKVVPLDITLKGEKVKSGKGENVTDERGKMNAEANSSKATGRRDSGNLFILHSSLQRILIVSGPNAGGKSVCLKTVGLLQYMLQCGLSIPVGDRSRCGIFENIMIDIGDEQSIEDDLSTYSSHLTNMKQMIRHANSRTLLLIDEFGGGTEPNIGGAIAEAVLNQFWKKQAFGVITTHYHNLKHFADNHEGVVNGAMLYDRNKMQALFQLSIGQPGSSFAIEIARSTGLPEEVIREASDIVGREYIQTDKYLQDIVRDKRYWEGKRQTIHQHEKSLEGSIARYESSIEEIEAERKAILRRAKEQAEELISQANRKIENAIREIREQQAEKEATRRIREEMEQFKKEVEGVDTKVSDEKIERKMQKIRERQERKRKMKEERGKGEKVTDESGNVNAEANSSKATGRRDSGNLFTLNSPLSIGSTVRIKGLTSIGTIEKLDGKMATVIFGGGMRTKMRLDRLEPAKESVREATKAEERNAQIVGAWASVGSGTRQAIDNRRLNFRQDLDVRGMRGDEAIQAVTYFIDDAILVGVPRVRILHGTGSGILRQLIRQYLATVPNVSHFRDEHVQFGGAGITVVEIE